MFILIITFFIVIATAVYAVIVKKYLEKNEKEAARIALNGDYKPKYLMGLAAMGILSVIGIFASAIWALFFR